MISREAGRIFDEVTGNRRRRKLKFHPRNMLGVWGITGGEKKSYDNCRINEIIKDIFISIIINRRYKN